MEHALKKASMLPIFLNSYHNQHLSRQSFESDTKFQEILLVPIMYTYLLQSFYILTAIHCGASSVLQRRTLPKIDEFNNVDWYERQYTIFRTPQASRSLLGPHHTNFYYHLAPPPSPTASRTARPHTTTPRPKSSVSASIRRLNPSL